MNWTEGNLARHSRGRRVKEDVLRQKRHFASLRAGTNKHDISRHSPIRYSHSPGPPAYPPSQQSLPVQPSVSAPEKRRSPMDQAHYSFLPQSSQYFQAVVTSVLNEEPRELSRDEEETLKERKRRLLTTTDWAGLKMQMPIDVRSASPVQTRRNSSRAMTRQRNPRPSTRHPIGSRYDEMRRTAPGWPYTSLHAGNIKIRIGDDTSSNLQPASSDQRCSPRVVLRRHSLASRGSRDKNEYDHSRKQQTRTGSPANEGPGFIDNQSHVCSASPLIYQPLPRPGELPFVLRCQSHNSDDVDSTLVQVSKRPAMSASQKQANELWRTLASSSDGHGGRSSFDAKMRQLISPGISEMRTVRRPPGSETSTKDIPARNHVGSFQKDCQTIGQPTNIPWALAAFEPRHSVTTKKPHSFIQDPCSLRDNEELPRASLNQLLTSSQDEPMDPIIVSPQPDQANSAIPRQRSNINESILPTGEDRSSIKKVGVSPNAIKGSWVPVTRECEPTARRSPHLSDEDEIWRKFVCSDPSYDEIEGAAMKEAIHEVTQDLRPPDPLDKAVKNRRTTPSGSQDSTSLVTSAEVLGNDGDEMEKNIPASVGAARGPNSNDQVRPASSERDLDSIDASHHYRATRVMSPCPYMNLNQSAQASTGMNSGANCLVADSELSTMETEPKANFKFSAPKLFMGKLAGTKVAPQQEQPRGKAGVLGRRRGRPKEKVPPGRTDIRAMPDYTEDPIEEYDQVDFIRMPPPSIFGTLETD